MRRLLDDLLSLEMRSLPNRIWQFDAYTHLHDAVKNHIAGHSVVMSDLKTEPLKDRHWKTILQRLGIQLAYAEVTAGLLWDCGVLAREKDEMLGITCHSPGRNSAWRAFTIWSLFSGDDWANTLHVCHA